MSEFGYDGHRIRYDTYGEGDRVVILAHGLLMNRGMHSRLGPALAERGHRAICVDLLGHGRSDRPEDLRLYSMPRFARQVSKLIDHLGLDSAVVGGTSLGANVALELATREPREGARPVHRDAGARQRADRRGRLLHADHARPALRPAGLRARLAGHLGDPPHPLPRRHGPRPAAPAPGPSLAVLEGLLLGETAPHREERRMIAQPTLIVGHTRDPVHPFSDSGMLAEELENATLIEANSILEWRITPAGSTTSSPSSSTGSGRLEKLGAAAGRRKRRLAARRYGSSWRRRSRAKPAIIAGGHGDVAVDDRLAQPVEPIVDPMQFDFAFVKAPVDFVRSAGRPRRSAGPPRRSADRLRRSAGRRSREVIQPFVGPALSHRLHDAILEDNTFRFGALKLNS